MSRRLLFRFALLAVWLSASLPVGAETVSAIGPGPSILAPSERIVTSGQFTIVTSPGPADHRFTEIELWDIKDGELAALTWSARIDQGDLTRADIGGGTFAPGIDGLESWNRYAIRARHGTSQGLTEWGPLRQIRTDDGSSEVFDPGTIGEIRLGIPESSWNAIDDEALSGCVAVVRDYYPGEVTIGTTHFPGSGIRAKGGCGSSRLLDSKTAFKANMSWDDPAVEGCPETRRYKGLKKITLNNQVEDASFVHERIGYDFFRKLGLPVQRAAPVRLYVNDELWGLYLHLETIDRRFLSRHFDSNDGMLYEGDYGCDLGESTCFEPKFDTDECDEPRQGDPTDMTPLQQLHARLAQLPTDDFYPAVDRLFDFDAYLTFWAAATVMGYWDGYPADPTNYRIYHDPSDDRWTLIPSGIDQLFEQDVNPFKPVGMLSIRCLAEDDCAAAFRARLAEVIRVFEASGYDRMARSIAKQIQADVAADPRKETDMDGWRSAVDSTVEYIRTRPGELRALLAKPKTVAPADTFHFHTLNDPDGERYIFVTWTVPAAEAGGQPQWLTAKGYFETLTARMDAIELEGGSSAGRKIGTVLVEFVDCETAHFSYQPDDPTQPSQGRTASIDSAIWKYCD